MHFKFWFAGFSANSKIFTRIENIYSYAIRKPTTTDGLENIYKNCYISENII
jgi:hypothetical protein